MKILFFAPHAANWITAFPNALMAESLKKSGHDIYYVGCGRLFKEYCIAMANLGLPQNCSAEKKKAACILCERNKTLLRQNLTLPGCDLNQELNLKDHAEIEYLLNRVDKNNFQEFQYEGLDLGKIAFYQTMLRQKKLDFNLSEPEWNDYRVDLRNTLRSYLAFRRVFERVKPDRCVVYNSLYSVNRICVLHAQRQGVPSYMIHAGENLAGRLQTLMVSLDDPLVYCRNLMEHWNEYKNVPCSRSELKFATQHMLKMIRGASVFSYSSAHRPGEDLRKRYGVAENQRVLLATMSSYDELIGTQIVGIEKTFSNLLFPTQLDWIRALIQFVRDRPDLFLIVRVHPREFPNKREKVKSQHAAQMQREFTDLPSNVVVNWPDDQISIFNAASEADVVLNAWSTAGKDLSMLGIPVVIYSRECIYYPPDLNYVGETYEEYFSQIDKALQDGWSLERARLAFRWNALYQVKGCMDLSASFRRKEKLKPSLLDKLARRASALVAPNWSQRRDMGRRAPTLRDSTALSELMVGSRTTLVETRSRLELSHPPLEDETKVLKEQLRQIADALWGKATPKTPLQKRIAEL